MSREAPLAGLDRSGRLRLRHGPIDLIVSAEGPGASVRAAHARAHETFLPILDALVAELPRLRSPDGADLTGPVAQRMQRATTPFAPAFITPMAAVAGAAADHVLAAMLTPDHGLLRAHVNNGGDIALWQSVGAMTLAICEDPFTRAPGARARIGAQDGIGGVATSGWRGRSHSLGIADAVTVLARSAAEADAAATLIANAVDLPGHPSIVREQASSLAPDSDLGGRLVTTGVGPLADTDVREALDRGQRRAEDYLRRGLIHSACLALNGTRRVTGAHVQLPEAQNA